MKETIFTKPLRMPDDAPGRTTNSIKVTYNEEGQIESVKKLNKGKWEESAYSGLTSGNALQISNNEISVTSHIYNPDVNSCAFGKDTVAAGQDQFVFGRNNVVDTEDVYAEIVGSDKFKVNKYGIEDVAIGAYVAKTGSPWWIGIKVGNTLEEALQFNFRNYSNLEVYQDADSSYHKLATLGAKDMNGDAFTAFGVNPIPTGNVIGVVMGISNGINNQYPSQGKYLLTGSTYWVYFDDGRVVQFYASNGYVTEWKDADGETQNIPVYSRPTIGSSTTIEPVLSVSKKNIRTLDWEGNQWNAGDITCDDGNGNTISMRDLLSRIATLEATANSTAEK